MLQLRPASISNASSEAAVAAQVPHHRRSQHERRDQDKHLATMSRRLWNKPAGALVKMRDYRVRITDGPNAYMQYKDVFVRGIYRFACERADPLIIDGGSNMGVSVLGFKHQHPAARVLAFEPDAALCDVMRENFTRNGIDGVDIIPAGLAGEKGHVSFHPDGSSGGQVTAEGAGQVRVERLSDHLNQPVDFVKLNIEGQELAVLQNCESTGRLRSAERIVLEYHGWAGQPQKLGELLNLLDRNGYRYLVHDFDAETCGVTKPPFRYRENANWFCLVFAQRM